MKYKKGKLAFYMCFFKLIRSVFKEKITLRSRYTAQPDHSCFITLMKVTWESGAGESGDSGAGESGESGVSGESEL